MNVLTMIPAGTFSFHILQVCAKKSIFHNRILRRMLNYPAHATSSEPSRYCSIDKIESSESVNHHLQQASNHFSRSHIKFGSFPAHVSASESDFDEKKPNVAIPCAKKSIFQNRILKRMLNYPAHATSSEPSRCCSIDKIESSEPVNHHLQQASNRFSKSHIKFGSFPAHVWASESDFDEKKPDVAIPGAAKSCNLNYESSIVHTLGKGTRVQVDTGPYHMPLVPFDICECLNTGSPFSHLHSKQVIESTERSRILRPGMVLLKDHISKDEQVDIVEKCRHIGLSKGGFYQPGYNGGAKLRLQMMCLGLSWDPQTRSYSKKQIFDNSNTPNIPEKFEKLVKRSIQEAHSLTKEEGEGNPEDVLPSLSPDICIVNFYTSSGKLGLHQDRDESRESLRKGLPVVSFSIGDSAEFLYGDERGIEKSEKVILHSGDVLIFGGRSRHVFHGVASIVPDSAPAFLREQSFLRPGRLNLTFRKF